MEHEVTLYQGNHSNEYLLSEMKNGKVEGRCQLFNRGILSLAWVMKNGKRIGEVTEYENGKALRKESWDSILRNDGDRRIIENSKEGLVMTIRRKCENNEENDDDDMMIYRGGFDEEMNRDGYGIEYDMENDGIEKIEGYWSKDKLIRIIREFDADNNKMIEYAENNSKNGNVDLLNRIPIYIGGYCIENGKYVRHGLGYLIDEASGTAIRESEWEHGKEKKGGIDLYEGWYMNRVENDIQNGLNNEDPTEINDEDSTEINDEDSTEINDEDPGEEKNEDPICLKNEDKSLDIPIKRIEIHDYFDFMKLDGEVTDLLICSKSCNDLISWNLNRFEWLQSIRIGSYCIKSVETFKIDGLNRLKTLIIGDHSFTWENGCGNDRSKSFHILNCESLETIEIDEFSFSDFAGDFELKNLPQLKSIQIGKIGSESCNFYFSSFVIRGIDMILII